MDYIPKPANPRPGIDVPLLEPIPLRSRPKHEPQYTERTQWYRQLCPRSIDIDTAIGLGAQNLRGEHKTDWGAVYHTEDSDLVDCALEPSRLLDSGTPQEPQDGQPRPPAQAEYSFASDLLYWYRFPIMYGLLEAKDPDNATAAVAYAGLLQSWAFFGLLELIFGERMRHEEWRTHKSSGDRSFVRWPTRLLLDLDSKIAGGPSQDLFQALAVLDDVYFYIETMGPSQIQPLAQVLLSIRLLRDALGGTYTPRRVHKNAYLTTIMLERGWCPTVAHGRQFTRWQEFTLRYYLLMMTPPQLNHDKCTWARCVASNVSMDASYRTAHVTSGCQCSPLGVDTTTVVDMITQGRVPLLRINERNGQILLRLEEATSASDYIAISHVWHDGLGNPVANALPTCQLKEILRLVQRMPQLFMQTYIPGLAYKDITTGSLLFDNQSSALIWMDTFCIPVSEDASDSSIISAKKLAIERMNSIYASARRVMVLDRSLLSTRLYTTSLLELYARIIICSWRTRCWTYQEGALALRCHFEFADVSINPATTEHWLCGPAELNSFQDFGTLFDQWQTKARSRHTWKHVKDGALSLLGLQSSRLEQPCLRTLHVSSPHCSQICADRLRAVSGTIINMTLKQSDGSKEVFPYVSDALNRVIKFANVWNEICRRASTYTSDTDLIIANMLELSCAHLPGDGKPHEQRLQAIIWSMELLPLNLLLIPGPKLDQQHQPRNRWVPTRLSDMLLEPAEVTHPGSGECFSHLSLMRLHAGALWTQAEAAPNHFLIILKIKVPRSEDLYIKIGDGTYALARVVSETTNMAPLGDEARIAFLMHDMAWDVLYGARLYITSQERHTSSHDLAKSHWERLSPECFPFGEGEKPFTVELRATYDCPVEYYGRFQLDPDTIPAEAVVVSPQDTEFLSNDKMPWRLRIDCDEFDHRLPTPGQTLEPTTADPKATALFYPTIWTYIALFWILFCIPVRVIITLRIGWASTNGLYKASTILFACYPLSFWYPWVGLLPLPEILFLASRLQSQDIQTLDIVYFCVATTFMLIAWLYICLFSYVTDHFGSRYATVQPALESDSKQAKIAQRRARWTDRAIAINVSINLLLLPPIEAVMRWAEFCVRHVKSIVRKAGRKRTAAGSHA